MLDLKKIKSITHTILLSTLLFSCSSANKELQDEGEEKDRYDGPAEIMQMEFEKTQDPALGIIPQFRMEAARALTKTLESTSFDYASRAGGWTERGPNSDAIGSSNGNTRGSGSPATSGRVRAILVDAADATNNTVFVGSVSGGLWKTTNFTAANPTWAPINDFLNNLAVSAIVQDPTNNNVIYFCTGESYYNSGAVQGEGVFKSTDGGATFSQLASSSTFTFCTKIVCDYQGVVYLATRSGLKRSNNAGSTWTDITPSGVSTRISDIEISSRTVAGRLHVSAGIFSTQAYRYTDAPQTVAAAGFSSPATAYPSYAMRAELAVSGNTLYALPADANREVPTIYKSTDGGANWAATGAQPTAGWASGQGWYALSAVINPANANEVIVGGLDNWRSIDGGATWSQISVWVGTTGNYCHADQQTALWYDGGNKLISGNDGGVFYSTNKGTTFTHKNTGLSIKQFYSVAMHPTSGMNHFLAGAQDNGSHLLTSAGNGASVEVTGGDGAFVHIDQNQSTYQFTSYVYNELRRSINGGSTWSSINLSSTQGRFINPSDYDNASNVMYLATDSGRFKRWTNPQTGSTSADVIIPQLASTKVSAVYVSANTSNRVFFGAAPNKLVRVDGANTIASNSAGTDITPPATAGSYLNCVNAGSDDNNLIVGYSNFGINNIYVSTNAGAAWTAIDGNLPDMPVRWVMFDPNSNTKALIATELGVWFTNQINGASTVWVPSPGFPRVRTDMLQHRASDDLIAAATYGRGVWTQTSASVLPIDNFKLSANWASAGAQLNWNYAGSNPGTGSFTIQTSLNGIDFNDLIIQGRTAATSYASTIAAISSPAIFFRIKYVASDGATSFSNIEKLSGNKNIRSELSILSLYPNPVVNTINVNYYAPKTAIVTYIVTDQLGKIVSTKQSNASYEGNIIASYNVANLAKGAYNFSIVMDGKRTQQRFIKQ